MRIFVVNCGSSSIKYQLFDMADESVLARGLLERLGTDESVLHHTAGRRAAEGGGGRDSNGGEDRTIDAHMPVADHAAGLRIIVDALLDPNAGVLHSVDQIDGVGHRVVHGGERITGSVRIDDGVLAVIRENAALAPLHNPPNLAGIEAAAAAIPDAAQVAVFDTAFLATLPQVAYRYAVPDRWYSEHHVRKYGFHGTSHRYVTLRAAELLGKPAEKLNLITAHLGNGCSMTAVAAGRAVDHSMGMTPLEGLIMGTRSGDIDPAVVLYMQGRGLTSGQVDEALNKQSGLLGVSQLSNDMRDLLAAAEAGDSRAALAVEMFVCRIVKYVGAYYAALPAVDAVVLTGGIGENCLEVRRRVCTRLASLGAELDERRNAETIGGAAGPITTAPSRLAIWVVPTNEELMIARDTQAIVAADKRRA